MQLNFGAKFPFQSKANTRLLKYIESTVIRIDLELIFFFYKTPSILEGSNGSASRGQPSKKDGL